MRGTAAIVGREAELAELRSFLDALPDGPAAVLTIGEAGIGKTTLWSAALADARGRGWRVLECRPGEAEVRLSYAALSDLLDPLVEDVLPELPAPQRYALERALLRRDAGEQPVDARTVAAGTLGVLRALSSQGPVVLGVDDVQWIDVSSANALEFAIRRLDHEPFGILVSIRATEASGGPLGLTAGLARNRVGSLHLTGMDLASFERMVAVQFEPRPSRSIVRRIHDSAGGNPFFGLELARAVLSEGEPTAGHPLPAPTGLRDVLLRRLLDLPASARDLLLVSSALSRPTVPLVESALKRPQGFPAALARSSTARIIESRGDDIRFTHPLFASAIYALAPTGERRRVHLRLAELVREPEERARHLALASSGPDIRVAEELKAAAAVAHRRGAPAAAAELSEFAIEMTPGDRPADIRGLRLSLADYLVESLDSRRAIVILEGLLRDAPIGAERAEILWRLGRESFGEDIPTSRRYLEDALQQDGIALATASQAHAWLAWVVNRAGQADEALRHARVSLELAGQSHDQHRLVDAIGTLCLMQAWSGGGFSRELLDSGVELERSLESAAFPHKSSLVLGILLNVSDDIDGARKVLSEGVQRAMERGDEPAASDFLLNLSEADYLAGDWAVALSHIAELSRHSSPDDEGSELWTASLAKTCLGRVESARADAEKLLAQPDAVGGMESRVVALDALGFLELSLGDASAAHGYLWEAWELRDRWGMEDPGLVRFVADEIEALIALGELNRAEGLLDWLDERGETLDRPWALAAAGRCRGLLLAAGGDFGGSLHSLDLALKQHEQVPMPFELGRTLLVLGTVRRRAKQKRPAREALEEALGIFERLGAPLWADKARGELARVGGRPAGATGELTSTEDKVARLAAAGRTNREIAATMFLSVRTVEAHLSRTYRKLGVRSRTELASWLDHDK